MKMKLIDLIIKQSKYDGDMPKKVEFHGKIFTYYEDLCNYGIYEEGYEDFLFDYSSELNDTVTILDNYSKHIEKLEYTPLNGDENIEMGDDYIVCIDGILKDFSDKINEIIDHLESKGDE